MTTLREVSRPSRAQRTPAKPPKETKQQRAQRLKKGRAKKLELRERLVEDPDSVLTFNEWCSLSGFSPRVGRRLLQGDNGPVVTRLSDRRIGISRKNHRDWLEKRARQ